MANTNAQPAIRSYFFGKGFKDLFRTISSSRKMNQTSSNDYKRKSSQLIKEYGYFAGIFPAAAMIFAAISVVIFGTAWFLALSSVHIVILAVLFSLVYIFLFVILLAENVYMIKNRIFTACPFCHTKSSLPYYLCPNCKAVHTRLVPGSYGILKRTCECGQKLPTTFFNGRNKLEAKCPNPGCLKEIQAKETTPVCIPIVGGPSVGKTCFLFAATRCLIEDIAAKNSWNVRFLNERNEEMYNRLSRDFAQGIVPAKTVELNPTAFNFFVGSSRWSPEKAMYLYDAAGEAFDRSDELVKHKFYGYIHGLVFLIDPFSIPELAAEYDKELKLGAAGIKPSEMMLEDTFDTMMINIEKNHGIKHDQKINRPCAVVINKIDAFDLDNKIGSTAADDLVRQRPNEIKSVEIAVDILCREFLTDLGLANFLRKLDRKFKTNRFFTCSTLGHWEEGKAFRPYGVSEPLTWLLGLADKDLAVKK